MPYLALQFPPGIFRPGGTEYQSRGRWYDGNLVRFFNGLILPVSGWQRHSLSSVSGKGRRILAWRDNNLNQWAAVGTESHLYVMNSAGTLYDITPSPFTSGNGDAGATDATVWSLDSFGQYLVGCTADDGNLYQWTLNTGTPATALSGAPTSCRALVVTDERFLFALGAAGVPRRVQWPDQASLTTWTPATTNQAGSFDLQSTGKLMCGKRVAGGTLLLTDFEAYLASYIGGTLIYSFRRLAEGCGACSQNCVAEFDGNAVWMGNSQFWLYNGYVQPLPCDVLSYVFGNMNFGQISKVTARVDSSVGEVTWHYPSVSGECDSYVTWSYREWALGRNVWHFGSGFTRMSGCDRGGVFTYPLCVGADGYIYDHEYGFTYSGGVTPYLESGPFELGNGDNVMHVTQLIPDEASAGDVSATFRCKFWPNGAETVYGPYSMSQPTDIRFCGRQAKVRFTGANADSWRIGNFRLEVRPGGLR